MSVRRGAGLADLSLLGIARRAGRLAIGLDAARRAIERDQAHLLVLASDLAPRTESRVRGLAGDLPTVVTASKEVIGRALGRGDTGIVVITDEGFARSLRDRWATPMEVKERSNARL